MPLSERQDMTDLESTLTRLEEIQKRHLKACERVDLLCAGIGAMEAHRDRDELLSLVRTALQDKREWRNQALEEAAKVVEEARIFTLFGGGWFVMDDTNANASNPSSGYKAPISIIPGRIRALKSAAPAEGSE